MISLGPLTFEPPGGFRCDEQMLSFVSPNADAPKKATSILLRQKDVADGCQLATLASEALADLAQSVKGIKNVSKAEIQFNDGQPGALFAYEFAARGRTIVRQFHAMRLDGRRLSSITLSADKTDLDDETASTFLDAIVTLTEGARDESQ